MKKNISILFVLILALFLRLFYLNQLPYNFHEDEVLSGYIGRFILENGKDIYGNPWPLFYFNKFGDYYIIGPIYLSGLSTYLFGVNEFAVRFPAALLGSLLTLIIYLLSKKLFKDKKIALLSALVYAVSPWSVVLSRTTTEGVIGSFTFTTALLFLLRSLEKNFRKNIFWSIFFSLLGYMIYHPFRIYPFLVFLLTFFLILTYKRSERAKKTILFSAILFLGLTLAIGRTPWGKGRFLQTSIFSKVSGVELEVQDLIFTENSKNLKLIRFFHNKIWHYGRKFLEEYLTYFSPSFLIFNSWEKLRYYTPQQGVFFITFTVFFYLGLAHLIVKKKSFEKSFLLGLLLIAPLPASLTVVESPNPHRAFFMLIPLSIITAYGATKTLELISLKKLVLIVFLPFVFYEFLYFIHQYKTHHDYFSAPFRNDGQKEAAFLLKKFREEYSKVYISSAKAMSWYYLFYDKNFSPDLIGRFKLDAKIDQVGNVYFTENPCPSNEEIVKQNKTEKIIIIDRPECESNLNDFKIINTFYGKNMLLKYKVLIPR